MRIPLNTQAELIVKLEAESDVFQIQSDYCSGIITKNAEGVAMLEPYADWEEIPDEGTTPA
jgi:hypothetical protein